MNKISFFALVLLSGNLMAAGYQGANQPQNQNYQVDVQQQQQQPRYKDGQVVSTNEPKVGNPQILTQIQDLLKNSHKNYVVTVHIVDDVVTLSGSVNSEEDKRGLEDRVRNIPGVKGVKNELTVNPNANQGQTANQSFNNQPRR
jgi:osmotically-inducible protein OsmY